MIKIKEMINKTLKNISPYFKIVLSLLISVLIVFFFARREKVLNYNEISSSLHIGQNFENVVQVFGRLPNYEKRNQDTKMLIYSCPLSQHVLFFDLKTQGLVANYVLSSSVDYNPIIFQNYDLKLSEIEKGACSHFSEVIDWARSNESVCFYNGSRGADLYKSMLFIKSPIGHRGDSTQFDKVAINGFFEFKQELFQSTNLNQSYNKFREKYQSPFMNFNFAVEETHNRLLPLRCFVDIPRLDYMFFEKFHL